MAVQPVRITNSCQLSIFQFYEIWREFVILTGLHDQFDRTAILTCTSNLSSKILLY